MTPDGLDADTYDHIKQGTTTVALVGRIKRHMSSSRGRNPIHCLPPTLPEIQAEVRVSFLVLQQMVHHWEKSFRRYSFVAPASMPITDIAMARVYDTMLGVDHAMYIDVSCGDSCVIAARTCHLLRHRQLALVDIFDDLRSVARESPPEEITHGLKRHKARMSPSIPSGPVKDNHLTGMTELFEQI